MARQAVRREIRESRARLRGVGQELLDRRGAIVAGEPTLELALAPDAGALAVVLQRTREIASAASLMAER